MSRLAAAGLPFAALVTMTLAATGAPSPTRAQDDPAGTDLTLTGQTFAVAPGQPWRVELTFDEALAEVVAPATTTTSTVAPVPADTTPLAPAEAAPAGTVDATLRFTVGRPVATRHDLAEVQDGAPAVVADTFVQPIAPTSTGRLTTLAVDVPIATDPAAADALVLRRPGLYPVSIEVVVDGAVVAEHLTFVERLPVEPAPAAPMNVAIVAATPDPGPNPTAEEVSDGRRRLTAIAETAAAVDGPISLSLPPVLLDALAGDEDFGATLRSSFVGDEVLAAPADVLDPSSAVAIDAQAAFTRELLEGEEILGTALPDNPPQRSAWLTATEISTGGATMLRNLGFRPLVFTPDIYNALEGTIGGFVDTTLAVEVDLGDGAPFPAIVLHATGGLLEPTAVTAGTSATDAAVQIMATLVTTRRELGADQRRSAVLVAPDTGIPDPDIAATLATFVAGMPDFALAPLSALASATDTMIVGDDGPQVVTLPATAGPDLTERARRIDLTRISAESSGSMMLDDAQLLEWRDELETLLSTAVSDAEVDATLERVSAEAAAVRAQVEVPRRFTFTLTGRSSPLRLNLRNTATEPLRVLVSPRSAKLTFPSGDQLVQLAPDGVTEVVIPVEARSNGTSSLEVAVLTPVFGQDIGDPVVLTARVNALTGLGQVVTGAAILVLLSWWYGHFRRRRRARLARVGEVDGPNGRGVGTVSPDAAEATVPPPIEEPAVESLADP